MQDELTINGSMHATWLLQSLGLVYILIALPIVLALVRWNGRTWPWVVFAAVPLLVAGETYFQYRAFLSTCRAETSVVRLVDKRASAGFAIEPPHDLSEGWRETCGPVCMHAIEREHFRFVEQKTHRRDERGPADGAGSSPPGWRFEMIPRHDKKCLYRWRWQPDPRFAGLSRCLTREPVAEFRSELLYDEVRRRGLTTDETVDQVRDMETGKLVAERKRFYFYGGVLLQAIVGRGDPGYFPSVSVSCVNDYGGKFLSVLMGKGH